MFASPFRKAPRHRFPTPEYQAMEQEIRRRPRPRSDTWLFAVIFVGPIVLLGLYELGHSMLFMQDVKSFAATIDQRPPAEVKVDVDRYAHHLNDMNPLVRKAAMTAMKLATGWNAGDNPGDWRVMWAEQGPYWEYRRGKANTPAPDWRSQLPAAP